MSQKGQTLLVSTAIYTGSSIANAMIPFFLLPVLTRVLTPEDYGYVSMFVLMTSVLSILAGLSTQGSVTVDYYRHGSADTPKRVAACLTVLAVSSVFLGLLLVLLMPWVTGLTKVPATWVGVALLVAVCNYVVNLRLALWRAQRHAYLFSGLQLAQGLVNAGVSLILVFYFIPDWQGRVLGISLSAMVFLLISLWTFLKHKEIAGEFHLGEALHAVRYGVPLLPHAIGGLVVAYADRVLVTNLLDLSQTGIYMVALQIGSALSLVTESVNRAYSPWLWGKLAEGDRASSVRIVRYTYLYFVFLLLSATLICLLAPLLLKLLVGPSFLAASEPFKYVVFAGAVEGMYYMVVNYIFYSRKTHYLAVLSTCSGLLGVPLSFLLISSHGIVGAAQALLITKLFSFVLAWYFSHCSHPTPWWEAIRGGFRSTNDA